MRMVDIPLPHETRKEWCYLAHTHHDTLAFRPTECRIRQGGGRYYNSSVFSSLCLN